MEKADKSEAASSPEEREMFIKRWAEYQNGSRGAFNEFEAFLMAMRDNEDHSSEGPVERPPQ